MPTLGDLASMNYTGKGANYSGMNTTDYLSRFEQGAMPTMSTDEISRAYGGYMDAGTNGQLIQDPQAAAAELARVKAFDPSATMQTIAGTQYSNETGTGQNPDQYVINYDQSLDPANNKAVTNQHVLDTLQKSLVSAKYDQAPYPFDPNEPALLHPGQNGEYAWLSDPSKVYYDPGTGKTFTDPGNYHYEYAPKQSNIDKLMSTAIPTLVMGVMTGGLASAFGPALGGVLGSALGQGVNMAEGGQFNPVSFATGSLGGFMPNIPGLDSILPYLKLAQSAYGASKGNIGAGVSTVGQLAKMGGFQFPTIGGGS